MRFDMRKVDRKPMGGERRQNDCSGRVCRDRDVEVLVRSVTRLIHKE